MKKLYLLGDSIRMGYEPIVKEKLAGSVDVFSPSVNCEFAPYILKHLHRWAEQSGNASEIDLVHWNSGLHDVLRMFGSGCLVPLDFYINTLKRIHERIKIIFPKAKIIFALTTGIIEERFEEPFIRYNSDIIEYNKAAVKIMNEFNFEINDLYAVTEKFSVDYYTDGTHFTEAGYCILADAVIKNCESGFQEK